MARRKTRKKSQGTAVEFSHVDKVYYPTTGFTKLVAQVSITEWTTSGNLRHATY